MAGPQADTLARHKCTYSARRINRETNSPSARAAPNAGEQDATVYPKAGALALILVAVYLAVFLVALVSSLSLQLQKTNANFTIRTEPSSQPLSLASLMSSSRSATWAGMVVRTSSPVAPSNSASVGFIPTTTQRSFSLSRYSSLKLAQQYAVQHPAQSLSLLAVPSLVWALQVYSLVQSSSLCTPFLWQNAQLMVVSLAVCSALLLSLALFWAVRSLRMLPGDGAYINLPLSRHVE
jgi:hypothetical protein